MARKMTYFDRDYLVKEHRSGRTVADLAREKGVSFSVIVRILGDDYTPIGRPAVFPVDEAIQSYLAGDSENSIAKRYGVSRTAIRQALQLRGIVRRTQSESESIKWSRMTSAQRSNQVRKAHNASRGSKRTHEQLCNAAVSKQQSPDHLISKFETILSEMLQAKGVTVSPQLAIGPYNCDIAIHPVAVEVWGGYWHFYGKHIDTTPKRFRYLMNAGWSILAIVIAPPRFPLTTAVADYVISHHKLISSNPMARREYRVIWGANEFSTAGSQDDDKIAIEKPFTGIRNSMTGQYETFPW